MTTTYPPGSRFLPTELGLVKLHLKNKVKNNKSGFIKTMNVYEDAPWRLDHDTNPLYPRNQWYYFVPRTTKRRTVPRNGESEGGTWSATGRKEIKNRDYKLKGTKRTFVFYKNVLGTSRQEKTAWHMDEFSLCRKGAEFHGLVLCHIKLLNSQERFRRPVPSHQVVNNNVLANQGQQEVGFAMPENDMMMVENDVNRHQQQYQENPPTLVNQGQYPSWDMALVPSHVDNNNSTFLPNQDQQEAGFVNQHQQQEQEEQQDSLSLLHRPFQSNHNQGQYLLEEAIAFPNQYHQQPQQDSLSLLHRPFQSNDNQGQYLLEANAYQNDMMIGQNDRGDLNQHDQQQQQQQEHYPPEDIAFNGADDDETFTLDEFLKIYNQGKEQQDAHDNQQGEYPWWDDFGGFNGAEENWIMQNMDVRKQQQVEEIEQELAKLLQQDSPTLVPSQMENNNNNTVLPNQNQQEANQNDMTMVEKEHGDVKQEQEQEDLTSRLRAPFQSNDNHGQCPPRDTLLFPSQVENNNNNTLLPNQEKREASFANQNDMSMVEKEHGNDKPQQEQEDSTTLLRAPLQRNDNQGQILGAEDDSSKCLTQEQLQQLEIIIGKMNMSF